MKNRAKTKIQSQKNRFDFEQEIQSAWNTCNDLNLFIKMKYDRKEVMTEDEEANILIGLVNIHNLRMEQVWETMEQLVEQRKLT